MESLSVMIAFDEFVTDSRSFDHSGVVAEDAGGVGSKNDLVDGLPVNFVAAVRGESPRR